MVSKKISLRCHIRVDFIVYRAAVARDDVLNVFITARHSDFCVRKYAKELELNEACNRPQQRTESNRRREEAKLMKNVKR